MIAFSAVAIGIGSRHSFAGLKVQKPEVGFFVVDREVAEVAPAIH